MSTLVIPSGSITLMRNNTPPTGWTKTNTFNAHCLRVVDGVVGSGGSINTTTVFATIYTAAVTSTSQSIDAFTMTTTFMPVHAHTYQNAGNAVSVRAGGPIQNPALSGSSGPNPVGLGVQPTLGTATHTHPISGLTATISGSLDMRVKYVDNILVQRA